MSSEEGSGEDEIPDKLLFRIGEVAEIVGVETHVLRYWESEFGLQPERSTSGQRLYRRADVARFLTICRLLHGEGFTIAGARKALQDPPGEDAARPLGADRIARALERVRAARERIAAVRLKMAQSVVGRD